MNHDRLHALTDGIFAIVMTLLVLELKAPLLHHPDSTAVWRVVRDQSGILVSYFISFITLFVYWRAHNFVVTILANNIDINLLSINGIFLFLVGLIPFSTQLAGAYSTAPLAVSLYAINIIAIGLVLIIMRLYVEHSEKIDNVERTREQKFGGLIRTLIPMTGALLAIPLSFVSTRLGFAILLFGVAFNLHNNAATLTRKWLIQPLAYLFRH